MTLKACKECKKEVSTKAKLCPHCGAPQAKSIGVVGIIFILFVGYLLISVIGVIGSKTNPTSTISTSSYAVPSASEPPPLEVQSWRCESEHGYSYVRGEVKNISSRKLENVTAVGEFRTASGELVKSEHALIEYNPILPGQTSPFHAGGTTNPEMKTCTFSFKELLSGTEISYISKVKSPSKSK